MRQRDEQSRPRLLPLGKLLDSRRGVQCERLPQLFRVRIVPGGIERSRVANELVHAHPAGEVVLLGEIADPRQDGDWIGDGIEAEDAHRAAFRAQQAQDVLDERRLARAVCADEAVDRPAWQGQAHRGQSRRRTKAARQLRYVDDRFTHARIPSSLSVTTSTRCYRLWSKTAARPQSTSWSVGDEKLVNSNVRPSGVVVSSRGNAPTGMVPTTAAAPADLLVARSEERRGGEEGRSR